MANPERPQPHPFLSAVGVLIGFLVGVAASVLVNRVTSGALSRIPLTAVLVIAWLLTSITFERFVVRRKRTGGAAPES